MLTYKLEEQGIRVIVTEGSYTSKASFPDRDDIPVYKEECETGYRFDGKRIHRGLYKSRDGILLNADINGACKIIRKVIPHAFAEVDAKESAGFFDNSSSYT